MLQGHDGRRGWGGGGLIAGIVSPIIIIIMRETSPFLWKSSVARTIQLVCNILCHEAGTK